MNWKKPEGSAGIWQTEPGKKPRRIAIVEDPDHAALIAASPDMLAALEEARAMLETAKQYFPKSIKNGDRYGLLNVLTNAVEPAIKKARGE